ncbi:MAG: tRNA glutamyl-Q(34) synthetase GluQRS [Lysobacterales bacterium]
MVYAPSSASNFCPLNPAPRYRGRFAPSPSGALHFGSLTSAVGSWLRARAEGGVWLVRIEDIDPARERPGAAQAILDALAAFGLCSDEPVLRQSQRMDLYRSELDRLQQLGLVYACACSRTDLAASGGLHLSACRREPGRTPCRRLYVTAETWCFDDLRLGCYRQDSQSVGDFVLWRKDDWPSYQLAVVVDDAAQSITEVVRGADLLDSTPRQIFLRQCLGYPPTSWLHLPLVVEARGVKLAKSLGSAQLDPGDPLPALRAALRFLGQPEHRGIGSPAALLTAASRDFSIAAIPAAGSARCPA